MAETAIHRALAHMASHADNGLFTGHTSGVARAVGIAEETGSHVILSLCEMGNLVCVSRPTPQASGVWRVDSPVLTERPDTIWTDEKIQKLWSDWNAGFSVNEIGRRLGVSKSAVVGKVHRLNLPPRPAVVSHRPGPPVPPIEGAVPRWLSPEADSYVVQYRNLGCQLKDIATALHTTEAAVGKRLQRLGIRLKKETCHTPVPTITPPRIEPMRKPAPDIQTAMQQRTRSPAGRPAVSVHSTNWSANSLPAPVRQRDGGCRWALHCPDDAVVGVWCAHHAALIGRKAA